MSLRDVSKVAGRPRLLLGIAVVGLVVGGLSGCGPTRAKGHLGATAPEGAPAPNTVVTRRDGQVVFHVLPYTGEMEKNAFGIDLHLSRQMAIELKIDYHPEGASPAVVVFRRQGVQLVFKDGTRRASLDPLQVYEVHQVDTTGPAIAFGLIGAAVASSQDSARKDLFTKSALYEIRLDNSVRSASGFLFFDWSGMVDLRGGTLVIEYTDSASPAARTVDIPL